jgi:hypothetical protein
MNTPTSTSAALSAPAAPLDATQVAAFRRDGFLILRGWITPEQLAVWRAGIERRFGPLFAPATQEAIRAAVGGTRASHVPSKLLELDPGALLHQLPQMRAVLAQLGGGCFGPGGTNLIINWPDPEVRWAMPRRGHIDGYPGEAWHPFMVAATAYVFDVEPQGGGTIVWPGSHRLVWEYFRAHPEQIDGSFRTVFQAAGHGWEVFHRGIEPIEFTGQAGDVIVWHSWLSHDGSPNTRARPRYGFFARVPHAEQEAIKRDVPADPWKYWGIGPEEG